MADRGEDSSQLDYEGELLACARGDRAALQRLYQASAPRLLGIATAIVRRRALAEEIIQDVFVDLWLTAGRFDPHKGSARAWLYALVRHRALNVVRALGREQLVDPQAMAQDIESVDFSTAPEALTNEPRLAFCLQQLDAPQRTSVLLAYVDGYSHPQIAARLQRPLGTVKAWIRRGLLALRACLG